MSGHHARPRPHRVGHQREGREGEIWVELAFTTAQSAERSGAPTPDDTIGSPGDWKGVRAGGSWGDGAGGTEWFVSIVFSFCHSFRRRRPEGEGVALQGSRQI